MILSVRKAHGRFQKRNSDIRAMERNAVPNPTSVLSSFSGQWAIPKRWTGLHISAADSGRSMTASKCNRSGSDEMRMRGGVPEKRGDRGTDRHTCKERHPGMELLCPLSAGVFGIRCIGPDPPVSSGFSQHSSRGICGDDHKSSVALVIAAGG